MVYRVTARLKSDAALRLRRALEDGSISAQQPDGQEIVDSLNRAVVTGTGEVIWSEKCYCDPPLAHERFTVLDRYFNDLNTEAIGEYELFDGRPFMEYLNESIARTEDGRSDRH